MWSLDPIASQLACLHAPSPFPHFVHTCGHGEAEVLEDGHIGAGRVGEADPLQLQQPRNTRLRGGLAALGVNFYQRLAVDDAEDARA